MTATYTHSIPAGTLVLHVAFELGANQWKLGFSTGLGVAVRLRTIGAGNLAVLRREIELAKKKFRLRMTSRSVLVTRLDVMDSGCIAGWWSKGSATSSSMRRRSR